ncbi:MAG: DUF4384 domain-containing protein [candidate division KSB1 bacterium]|nr:DUF4384 domain-containing protein [candidate division KSB1 bacterium]MDZ7272900.1 DUF4384 domain-containing protein [candidate division KSB1 bacterium]MDZ7284078.1 DUF4384 domain-containing protein [candidate division KSB1 bacterium]MDZ7297525.1 DUF4384 domain-containing protein [candidate division KSB1 bacterium]MDZ7308261.1 DUF4384 domain-containing protein [candidate division KSB1 bacterium]
MNRSMLTFTLAAVLTGWLGAGAQSRNAAQVEITAQPRPAAEPAGGGEIDLTIRTSSRGYLTLYQVTSTGGFEILYPKPHHCWRALEAGRSYRLQELAEDVRLQYESMAGNAYVGAIFTARATHIVPWVEQALRAQGLSSGRGNLTGTAPDPQRVIADLEADMQYRLGISARPAFAVAAIPFGLPPGLAQETGDSTRPVQAGQPSRAFSARAKQPALTPPLFGRSPGSAGVNAFEPQHQPVPELRSKPRDTVSVPAKLSRPDFLTPGKQKTPPPTGRATDRQRNAKSRERN